MAFDPIQTRATLFRIMPGVFVCLWATGFIGARLAMPHAEPFAFLTIRHAVTFILLTLIALAMRSRWPSLPGAGYALIIGALIHGIYLGSVFWAIDRGMPAGVAAMIVGLQPLITALIAVPVLGETVTRKHWLGLLIGLAGLALVLLPKFELPGQGIGFETVAACFAAVLAISAGTIIQKGVAGKTDLLAGTTLQYLGALIFTGVTSLIMENQEITWNGDTLFALAWLVLVLSIGAVFLLMLMIREGSVAQVASLFYLVPAIAALIAWFLFAEELSALQIGGMALCAFGVALATARKKPGAANRPEPMKGG